MNFVPDAMQSSFTQAGKEGCEEESRALAINCIETEEAI